MIFQIVICLLIYVFSIRFVYKTGKDFYKDKPKQRIYDVSHTFLPNLFDYKPFKDYFLILLAIPLLRTNEPLSVLREIIGYFIVLTIIRSFTTAVTILPKTDSRCKTDKINWLGACHDLSLSGHTAFCLIVTLIFLEKNLININLLFLFNVVNIFAILSTRSHYTIDVILAIFVTMFVYQNKIKV